MLSARLYGALLTVLALLVMCSGCYVWGRASASGNCDLAQAKTELGDVGHALVQTEQVQSAAAATSDISAQRHERIATRFKPIEREVIRYVQTPVAAAECLDADGLRLWSAANRGEFEATASARTGHAALPSGEQSSIGADR